MEEAFLAGLREKPDDAVTRLVYADWLDEQPGGEARLKAEYLRVEARQLEAWARRVGGRPTEDELPLAMEKTGLALRLPPDWLLLVARVPVEGCAEPACPRRWELLSPCPDTPRQRMCKACGERVHWCESITFARENVFAGRRVALDERLIRTARDLEGPYWDVGEPEPEPPDTDPEWE
jgi:uncharacterized protein (TIGR02996 family)